MFCRASLDFEQQFFGRIFVAFSGQLVFSVVVGNGGEWKDANFVLSFFIHAEHFKAATAGFTCVLFLCVLQCFGVSIEEVYYRNLFEFFFTHLCE